MYITSLAHSLIKIRERNRTNKERERERERESKKVRQRYTDREELYTFLPYFI